MHRSKTPPEQRQRGQTAPLPCRELIKPGSKAKENQQGQSILNSTAPKPGAAARGTRGAGSIHEERELASLVVGAALLREQRSHPWSQAGCSRELEMAPIHGIKHPRAGRDRRSRREGVKHLQSSQCSALESLSAIGEEDLSWRRSCQGGEEGAGSSGASPLPGLILQPLPGFPPRLSQVSLVSHHRNAGGMVSSCREPRGASLRPGPRCCGAGRAHR